MLIKRDIATAAAAMRVGYSNNRKDLMTAPESRESTGKYNSQFANSLEPPGFRVYGKNQGAREHYENQKAKNRTRIHKFIEPLQQNPDFSFRARQTGGSPGPKES